jgi:hypothetical protein
LIVYEDDSKVYAVCLCDEGELLRTVEKHGTPTSPAWHLWAARNSIPHEQICMLEDAVTPEELKARGFTELSADASMDAIITAARNRKAGR